jgi:hypothetical protein
MKTEYKIGLFLLIWQILDIITTYIGVGRLDLQEYVSASRVLIQNHLRFQFIFTKILSVLWYFGLLYLFKEEKSKKVINYSFIFLGILSYLVVLNNIVNILLVVFK